LVVPQKRTAKKQSKPKTKGWRPKGKTIVKDKLHGASHEIIETKPVTMTAEQIVDNSKNPLSRMPHAREELLLKKTDEVKMWKERAIEAGQTIMKKNDEIEALRKGQMLPASEAAPMDVQKMKEQIIELQEKLQPYKYEFTVGGSLVSVMVRPRAREVIPLTQ
jgi:hypothetical protein